MGKFLSSTILKRRKRNTYLIGKNFKELRKNEGFTLEVLSNKTKIHIEPLKQYESNLYSPNLNNLNKLSNFYGVSIDFLILWDKTNYIRSTRLIELSKIIDKLDQVKRFQVESTAMTLIGDKISNVFVKEDSFDLTNDIHLNLKQLRESSKVSQNNIADYLNISQGLVANYERITIPPLDNLIKLAEFFSVSIHSLVTGENLTFQLANNGLKDSVLKADQLLSIKDKSFLILLMDKIIMETKT